MTEMSKGTSATMVLEQPETSAPRLSTWASAWKEAKFVPDVLGPTGGGWSPTRWAGVMCQRGFAWVHWGNDFFCNRLSEEHEEQPQPWEWMAAAFQDVPLVPPTFLPGKRWSTTTDAWVSAPLGQAVITKCDKRPPAILSIAEHGSNFVVEEDALWLSLRTPLSRHLPTFVRLEQW